MNQNGADILLAVHDLKFSYRQRQAVRNASFQIRQGEIFGILGPNGAGKTTTISCICGLLKNYEGSIHFKGQEFLPSTQAEDRRRLGVVPQDLAIYENLSGEENLRFFGRISGLAEPQIETAVKRSLALAGLENRAQDRVAAYSGGMKRRLNLAAGELHEPELLILDEPTVGVDPQSRNHIFEALERIREKGRTLIYTTHYMEEAERLCNRIAIMHEGNVLTIGTVCEIAERAGCPGSNLEESFLRLTGRSLRDS